MEIFKDNNSEIKNDFIKGSLELDKLHKIGKLLNLYESMVQLKSFSDSKISYNNNVRLYLALRIKEMLKVNNFKNFKNYYFELYELFLGMKDCIEKHILVDGSKSEDNIKLDNKAMFSVLREYYMTSHPYIYSLFTGVDKGICISNKSVSAFNKSISSSLLNNNYIFVDNRENVTTTADIVLNLELLATKKDLEHYNSKDLYKYLYLDNFKYAKPLIERKKYLKWLIEKDTMYYDTVNTILMEDYSLLLDNINELSNIMKRDKNVVLEDKSIDVINYVYGHFLSDIYLYLDEEQREEFLKYIRNRNNKLFKKDILYFLEELTGFRSYGLSKIVETQYKKYTKKK